MHNEFDKMKIKEKFKFFKASKIKYIHTLHPLLSKDKNNTKKNKINFKPELYCQKKLYLKYNTLPEKYALIQINIFVKAKYCHALSSFKENLLFNYHKEFMKKYFTKSESIKKIPLFAEFYKTYLQFFCSPTLKELNLNELIEEMVEIKAMAFYKENYEDEKDKKNKEKNKCINTLFFTNEVRKDISRKNTLADLSKTTIKFNNNNYNNYANSNKSINSLINEMEKKPIINNNIDLDINEKKYKKEILTDRNNKKNEIIKKNLFTGSSLSITPTEGNISLAKKFPKIKLNLNLITNNKIAQISNNNILNNKKIKYLKNDNFNLSNNSTNKNKPKKDLNNSKPMYHKINIVNNKIIIINNNTKSKGNILNKVPLKENKIKKAKKKNNLTLLTRNYVNNNYFGSFYGGTFDLFNSQDKIMRTKNFNTSISIKSINKLRKTSIKLYNSTNNNNKTVSKIMHIKKIKDKNLTLQTKNYQNIHPDNNIKLNQNLFSNYLKGAKTDRDNFSKDKIKQKWTNYQLFNNNIRNINKMKYLNNISNDKFSSKNIKSTNSILNKNGKIKSILKLSNLNTIENIRKIHNKSKNGSIKKVLSKNKIKNTNLKMKEKITNNKTNFFDVFIKNNYMNTK